MKYCSINGEKINHIAITDRGLAYGDGIFTTAKIVAGQVLLLSEHIERLILGCKHLNISSPIKTELEHELVSAASGFSSGVLKVIISAGSGGRGYSRQGLIAGSTQFIVMVFDFPSHYPQQAQEGLSLGISQQQISISPMLGGIKHLNRLEQVLLRTELDQRVEDDLVVLNTLSEVVEATSANLFYWLDNKLHTPALGYSGVNGLIRQTLLKHNTDVVIKKTSLDDLKKAEAMFICNCVMGIMPINQFNNRALPLNPVQAFISTTNDLNIY
ncbi:aminodeoxychorismate lyase [Colwellia sp. D2M02]|uniref:aminodeoxychorismate lyase n=1 Tax=Colwellia sp. D2M02 TaxID=2841562 RepID=UPI001C092C8E|nr:aminodeoxychorismate lyase [Colwellia sp. D2M02]MBU2892594.1 aminodeoxychorismate lyase [Colwellia sp. D2M02]